MTHAEPHSFGYIRITNCSSPSYWYSALVGQTIPLRRPRTFDHDYFYAWEDHPTYKLLNFVHKKDATYSETK